MQSCVALFSCSKDFLASPTETHDMHPGCHVQSATRSLAPLEATAGVEKAQQIRSSLNALGAKKVRDKSQFAAAREPGGECRCCGGKSRARVPTVCV